MQHSHISDLSFRNTLALKANSLALLVIPIHTVQVDERLCFKGSNKDQSVYTNLLLPYLHKLTESNKILQYTKNTILKKKMKTAILLIVKQIMVK